MRIAYVTPYQGPTLIERRPIVKNRSMSNRTKIELIARMLRSRGHDVEVFSHGEVIENELKFYPAFDEPDLFHPEVPVRYISALPIRRVNGLWSGTRMVALLDQRHRAEPFDIIIIFNLKRPQLGCARYAVRRGISVVLEYEDDVFQDVDGRSEDGILIRYHHREYRKALESISGCIAVSPHLAAQVPKGTPTLILRGVIGDDVLSAGARNPTSKRNIVLFSGTHVKSNGVEELIEAWRLMAVPGWELHITGYGDLTERLRTLAKNAEHVVFHGLVSREELVGLMCSARIGINPHSVSRTPGNVFAFKIIEYMAAGAHVVTTPMGDLEPALEDAITYMPDNEPSTIAATLRRVIEEGSYERRAERAVEERYGPVAVSTALDSLLERLRPRSTTEATARG